MVLVLVPVTVGTRVSTYSYRTFSGYVHTIPFNKIRTPYSLIQVSVAYGWFGTPRPGTGAVVGARTFVPTKSECEPILRTVDVTRL
jgi:hypothetical protein